jgi:DNA repair ATPase RecN
VEKTSSRGRTWSSVRVLDAGGPRTRELARMMSGAIVTSEALAAAEALVRAARESTFPGAARSVSRARRVV